MARATIAARESFRSNTSVITTPTGGVVAYGPNLLNAGAMRARGYNHFAGEVAGIWGPVTLQGEYHHVNVQRKPLSPAAAQRGNVSFHGWHVQAGYILTGESRGYDFKTGTIGTIKPTNACGAWELVARYSSLNLEDKDINGGTGKNLTLGANWYVNNNVRFALNYIRADINPTGAIAGTLRSPNTPKRKMDFVAARIQVVF